MDGRRCTCWRAELAPANISLCPGKATVMLLLWPLSGASFVWIPISLTRWSPESGPPPYSSDEVWPWDIWRADLSPRPFGTSIGGGRAWREKCCAEPADTRSAPSPPPTAPSPLSEAIWTEDQLLLSPRTSSQALEDVVPGNEHLSQSWRRRGWRWTMTSARCFHVPTQESRVCGVKLLK